MIGDEPTDSQRIATTRSRQDHPWQIEGQGAEPDAITPERLLLRTAAHALRHAPEAHFLDMDADGWVDLDLLLLSLKYARPECGDLSADDLKALAGEGESARFEITENRIRVSRGRETQASHRTAETGAIRADGLRPMRRKFVHLSSDWNYASAESFCKWLVRTDRVTSNPLNNLARLNNEVDVRHRRRALTPEEATKLVTAASESNKRIQGYDGGQRARVYLMSYLTGLRRSELASLTPASFNLAATQPTVTVSAACSKHRRTDVLPLHPELFALLPGWLAGMKSWDKLFPKLDRKKTWMMVKLDLERVGIPYENEEGIADFHASGRHSYVTGLLRHGATLPEAKELARHSDVRMTMRYTHIGLNDQAQALASLPSPQPKPAATLQGEAASDETAGQHSGQHSGGPNGQNGSEPDNGRHRTKKNPEASSTAADGTYDASGQSRQNLAQILLSGGGGDRTRVPRCFRTSVYVCSRWFNLVRRARIGTVATDQPGTFLTWGILGVDPRRSGFGNRLLGLTG